VRTTPFHDRTEALNVSGLWDHWAGHLSARQYGLSEKQEYFTVRNGVGVYDTSPVYKYRIHGTDAEKFLSGVLARDVRTCKPGHAQYTIWCDEDGYLVEDGILFRLSDSEFLLTAVEPNASYFSDLADSSAVRVDDVSDDFASLAVQGPLSKAVLAELAPEVDALRPFDLKRVGFGDHEIVVSRTGFTGDLGYELWVEPADALAVWDALFEVGAAYGIAPFGETALIMTRIEAGLLLIDAEFHSSRYAWSSGQRSTPLELGLGWMLRDIESGDRPFIGRRALQRELAEGSRWHLVGLTIDWEEWDERYRAAGQVPPKDHTPIAEETILYNADQQPVGFTTSFMYSPMMQSHIAIAQVIPELSSPGNVVDYEVLIDHGLQYITATVTGLPFYDPPHRTA
jgi:aminomethyltransferase